MSKFQNVIKVGSDQSGYIAIRLKFFPSQGFAQAYYNNKQLAASQHAKLSPPAGDNEQEWDQWEQDLIAWKDEATQALQLQVEKEIGITS